VQFSILSADKVDAVLILLIDKVKYIPTHMNDSYS